MKVMATPEMTRMRVRFTAEIDYKLRSRSEGIRVENDPGFWTGFTDVEVRDALERVLRWRELSLSTGQKPGVDSRSKWSPTDTRDKMCQELENGRIVHVDGCGCRNAVIVVDVEIER